MISRSSQYSKLYRHHRGSLFFTTDSIIDFVKIAGGLTSMFGLVAYITGKLAVIESRFQSFDEKINNAQKNAVKESLDQYLKCGFLNSVEAVRVAQNLALEKIGNLESSATCNLKNFVCTASNKMESAEQIAGKHIISAEASARDTVLSDEYKAGLAIANTVKEAIARIKQAEEIAIAKHISAEDQLNLQRRLLENAALMKLKEAEDIAYGKIKKSEEEAVIKLMQSLNGKLHITPNTSTEASAEKAT